MRGMQKNLRGGFLRDRHAEVLQSSKYKACKYVRMDRTQRLWRQYAHGLLCVSVCLFIITLRPDWIWFLTSDRPVTSPPALEVGNSLANTVDSVSLLHPRPLLSNALELKEERPDIRRTILKDVHRDYSTIDQGVNSTQKDQGGTESLGLSTDLKIFVYELPSSFNEDWLTDARCSNHLFAAEVAIHQRLLRSPLRTFDPLDADFFYVPVYVSCNFSSTTGFPSLGHARNLLQSAVKLISHEMPFWNRSGGSDHVFVASHDYGPCFHTMEDMAVAAGIPDFLRRSVILQTFAQVNNHACQAADHIQIPPFVPPSSVKQSWLPDKQHRDIWAFFRGKMEVHPKNNSGRIYSRGVRTAIWRKFRRDRRFFIKRKRSAEYQSEIRRSVFCLCPLGWAPWSPRIVESVIFGCVPVIIADKIALPYSHVINWTKISLSVPEKDVGKLDKILEKVSRTNLTTIQKNLWKEDHRRALLYTDPLVNGDATWQIFEQLSRKLIRSSSRNAMPLLANLRNHTQILI